MGARRILAELLNAPGQIVFVYVVAQDGGQGSLVREILGQRQGLGNAARLFLNLVRQPGAELLARPKQAQKVPGVLRPGNYHDLAYPRARERLQGIVDHGLVVDGQKVLVRDLGQRPEPGAEPACQNYSFHTAPVFRYSVTASCQGRNFGAFVFRSTPYLGRLAAVG